jgi:hypothetical protein
MSGTLWSKFYWSDWESDPAVRLCSFAAQGFWMRMLCIAAAHDPIGYVAVAGKGLDETSLARLTGCQESEVTSLLGELERNGVFSRDRHNRIYSRRMVSDAKKAAIARKNGKNGGNPTLSKDKGNSASDKGRDKPEVKPHKPEARSQEAATQLGTGAFLYDRLIEAASSRGNCHEKLALGIGQITDLIAQGYDLDTDILPVIREKARRDIASWKFFVTIIVQRHAERQAIPQKPEPAGVDWAGRVAAFYEDGTWGRWGPRPGEHGCEAPAELLKRTAA